MSSSDDLNPQEVASATERLADQVSALSSALQSIGQIQRDQAALKDQVQAVKEDVKENAVPKHEFTLAQQEAEQKRSKLQTRIRVFAIGISIVALGGSVVAGYVTLRIAHHQRKSACEYANSQRLRDSAKTKPFFQPFLDQEAHNPKADPVMVELITTIVNTPPQLTDCSKL